MYFDTTSILLKNQIRENIFSLLGNRGKTLFSPTESYDSLITFSWSERLVSFWNKIATFPHKKPLGYLLVMLSAFMMVPPDSSFAAEKTQTFIVTAYYSPLPGQSFYLRGNYEAEKKLNGNGTHGASGAPVFTGMIAAPKSYAFGTQIFFEGLGVGTVSDRGGAIVDAYVRGQAYDRIDIWMGYGETGLRRALAWWRREVTGTYVPSATAASMNAIDLQGISNGRVDLSTYPAVKSPSAGSLTSDVLQAFADLGYTPMNGDTRSMLIQFQLDHKIITSASDDGAGNYGPKTKAALAEAHKSFDTVRNSELEEIEKAKAALLADHDAYQKSYNLVQTQVSAFGTPRAGDQGTWVKNLQAFLQENGFFKGSLTGRMNGATIAALKKYQKARWLSSTGSIDATTKSMIIDEIMTNV